MHELLFFRHDLTPRERDLGSTVQIKMCPCHKQRSIFSTAKGSLYRHRGEQQLLCQTLAAHRDMGADMTNGPVFVSVDRKNMLSVYALDVDTAGLVWLLFVA